jgi:hypothetical protein
MAVLGVVVSSTAAAQSQDPTSLTRGTSSVAGRIVERAAQRPLAGASVILTEIVRGRDVIAKTDADGRYIFDNVAAGEYRLRGRHPEYVEEWYGGLKMGDSAAGVFQVGAIDRVHLPDVALARAGAIHGRVIDQQGHPIEGATVTATFGITEARLLNASAVTRADGSYELKGLPEANLAIRALPDRRRAMAAALDVSRNTGSTIVPSAPEYEPMFYPGVKDLRDASYVRVDAGAISSGIDITLPIAEFFIMSGQIVPTNPVTGKLEITLTTVPSGSMQAGQRAADNMFTFARLKPGRYVLWARAQTAYGIEAATQTFDVDRNFDGVRLELVPAGRISGRVITEQGDPLPIEGFRIAAALLDNNIDIDPRSLSQVEVAADGSFSIEGLFGDRSLRVFGLPAGWEQIRVESGRSAVERLWMSAGAHHDVLVIIGRR